MSLLSDYPLSKIIIRRSCCGPCGETLEVKHAPRDWTGSVDVGRQVTLLPRTGQQFHQSTAFITTTTTTSALPTHHIQPSQPTQAHSHAHLTFVQAAPLFASNRFQTIQRRLVRLCRNPLPNRSVRPGTNRGLSYQWRILSIK